MQGIHFVSAVGKPAQSTAASPWFSLEVAHVKATSFQNKIQRSAKSTVVHPNVSMCLARNNVSKDLSKNSNVKPLEEKRATCFLCVATKLL
jgi:hypothetical protein